MAKKSIQVPANIPKNRNNKSKICSQKHEISIKSLSCDTDVIKQNGNKDFQNENVIM